MFLLNIFLYHHCLYDLKLVITVTLSRSPTSSTFKKPFKIAVFVLNEAYSCIPLIKSKLKMQLSVVEAEEGGQRDLHGGRKIREFVRLNRSTRRSKLHWR